MSFAHYSWHGMYVRTRRFWWLPIFTRPAYKCLTHDAIFTEAVTWQDHLLNSHKKGSK